MILEENTECAAILSRKLLSNQRRLLHPMIFFLLFTASKTWPTLAMRWRNLPFSQLGDKSTEKDKVLHPNVFTGNHQVLHLFLFQVVEHLVVVFQTAIRLKMPLIFFGMVWNANKRTDAEKHWQDVGFVMCKWGKLALARSFRIIKWTLFCRCYPLCYWVRIQNLQSLELQFSLHRGWPRNWLPNLGD